MPADSEAVLPALGFIGLGAMGGPMARNLLAAGYALTGFDIDADRLDATVEAGAACGDSAADVVQRSEVVLTSLRSSAVWVEVAEAALVPNAREGQAFIDLGTVAPPETRRLAAAFAERGASLLDVPVSGGPGGSTSGTLRMFAGGDRAVYERCRPILEVLGDPERVVYMGPSGAGQVAKGVNQLAMGLADAAYLEAIALGCAKVNISTAIKYAFIDGFVDYHCAQKQYEPLGPLQAQIERVEELVTKNIKLFGRHAKAG